MPRFAAPDGRSFRRQSWFPFPCGTGVVVRRSVGLFPRPVLPLIGELLLTAPCCGGPEFGDRLQSTLPPPRSGRAGFETLDPAPVALGCCTGVPMRRQDWLFDPGLDPPSRIPALGFTMFEFSTATRPCGIPRTFVSPALDRWLPTMGVKRPSR